MAMTAARTADMRKTLPTENDPFQSYAECENAILSLIRDKQALREILDQKRLAGTPLLTWCRRVRLSPLHYFSNSVFKILPEMIPESLQTSDNSPEACTQIKQICRDYASVMAGISTALEIIESGRL